jgi:hypothetical protein
LIIILCCKNRFPTLGFDVVDVVVVVLIAVDVEVVVVVLIAVDVEVVVVVLIAVEGVVFEEISVVEASDLVDVLREVSIELATTS